VAQVKSDALEKVESQLRAWLAGTPTGYHAISTNTIDEILGWQN